MLFRLTLTMDPNWSLGGLAAVDFCRKFGLQDAKSVGIPYGSSAVFEADEAFARTWFGASCEGRAEIDPAWLASGELAEVSPRRHPDQSSLKIADDLKPVRAQELFVRSECARLTRDVAQCLKETMAAQKLAKTLTVERNGLLVANEELRDEVEKLQVEKVAPLPDLDEAVGAVETELRTLVVRFEAIPEAVDRVQEAVNFTWDTLSALRAKLESVSPPAPPSPAE